MSLITIDPERCQKDGLCVRICHRIFSQKTDGSVPTVAHEELCNACGHCVMICPSGAIRHSDCLPENLFSVQNDLMPSYDQMLEMVKTRRSIRTFQEKQVERQIIEKVIDGARFAPSANNTQSTRFIVIQDAPTLRAIASSTAEWLGKMADRLRNPLWRNLYLLVGQVRSDEIARRAGQLQLIAERMRNGTDLVLFGAPVLIFFHADKGARFANENANLALQNATLLACSLGLGSFYTGYVVTACSHDRTIPQLLELPKNQRIYGGLALGYPKVRFSKWLDRNPAQIRWI